MHNKVNVIEREREKNRKEMRRLKQNVIPLLRFMIYLVDERL